MFCMPLFKMGVWNAWLYMSIFLLQMLVMLFAGKQIWEKSHVPVAFRQTWIEKKLSLINTVIWLASIAYSVFLPLRPVTTWFFAGTALYITGAILMMTATITFIRTPPDQLITTGLYRYSRNPLYLAALFVV